MPAITISLESSSSDEGEQQLRDDEAFARRLQAEEDAAYAAELQGADAPAGILPFGLFPSASALQPKSADEARGGTGPSESTAAEDDARSAPQPEPEPEPEPGPAPEPQPQPQEGEQEVAGADSDCLVLEWATGGCEDDVVEIAKPETSETCEDSHGDSDLQITGRAGLAVIRDCPHQRFCCEVEPFTKGNEHAFCPNCYCVKCQVPASECKEWAEHATIAKKKKPLKTYRTDRQLLRESRAYGIGADTAERSKRARKAPGRYDPNVDGLSDRQRNARARNL